MKKNDQEIFVEHMAIRQVSLFLILSFIRALHKLVDETVLYANKGPSFFRRHEPHYHLKQLVCHLGVLPHQNDFKLFDHIRGVAFFHATAALTYHDVLEQERVAA